MPCWAAEAQKVDDSVERLALDISGFESGLLGGREAVASVSEAKYGPSCKTIGSLTLIRLPAEVCFARGGELQVGRQRPLCSSRQADFTLLRRA